MKSLLLGFAIFMLLAGLALAFSGFALGMKNGHVVCCYTDMLITPKLSQALDDLGVTNEELVVYLAKNDARFVSADASEQSREHMAFLMAQALTPDARDLYVRKVMRGANLGFVGGGVACMGGTFLLIASRSVARSRRKVEVGHSVATVSEAT